VLDGGWMGFGWDLDGIWYDGEGREGKSGLG